jgi:hypothetical protein
MWNIKEYRRKKHVMLSAAEPKVAVGKHLAWGTNSTSGSPLFWRGAGGEVTRLDDAVGLALRPEAHRQHNGWIDDGPRCPVIGRCLVIIIPRQGIAV